MHDFYRFCISIVIVCVVINLIYYSLGTNHIGKAVLGAHEVLCVFCLLHELNKMHIIIINGIPFVMMDNVAP